MIFIEKILNVVIYSREQSCINIFISPIFLAILPDNC